MTKTILHIDINAFFASCHIAMHPSLKPFKVAVAKNCYQAIIVAANYHAKAAGVKVPISVVHAKKICPELLIIKPEYNLYQRFSQAFFLYLKTVFGLSIEVVSIDECFADATPIISQKKVSAFALAKQIQKHLLANLFLPCSIGIGDNLFFAKMASNLKKPLGISVINQDNFKAKLWPLKIIKMHGVGQAIRKVLLDHDINLIHDLVSKPIPPHLPTSTTNYWKHLISLAQGEGSAIINLRRIRKSYGGEQVLGMATTDHVEIKHIFLNLIRKTHHDLLVNCKVTKTVCVYLHHINQVRQTSCQKTLSSYTNNFAKLSSMAIKIFYEMWNPNQPLILIGVRFMNVIYQHAFFQQMNFLNDHSAFRPVDVLIHDINNQAKRTVLTYGDKYFNQQVLSYIGMQRMILNLKTLNSHK